LRTAHIGRFKPLCDFDWAWPKRCDRAAVDTLMTLEFLNDAANVVLVGPNGVGKSMIAQNIAHQALTRGHTVLFTSAGQLLGDLCALDSDSALRRRLRHYARPHLLVIDEVGYLSYSNRHADLMFELISRRYQNKSTLVTTNRTFAEWREVFPNAACVVSLVDRLLHNSEIVAPGLRRGRLSKANPIASRKPATAPNNAPASAAAPSHEHAAGTVTVTSASASPHRRDPSHLDTGGGACGVRADRRSARQDLCSLQRSTTGSASRAMRRPS
jgi:DNA replication protein DnaC